MGDTECANLDDGADAMLVATSPLDDDDACDEDDVVDVADTGIARASAYEVRDEVDELLELCAWASGDVCDGDVARLFGPGEASGEGPRLCSLLMPPGRTGKSGNGRTLGAGKCDRDGEERLTRDPENDEW